MKKNINFIKEIIKNNVKISKSNLIFDIYTISKKEKLLKLINTIKKYYKKNRLGSLLQSKITNIINNYNLAYLNERGIILDMNIFNSRNIIDIQFIVSFETGFFLKTNKLFNRINQLSINYDKLLVKNDVTKYFFILNNLTGKELELVNSINFQLTEVYMNGSDEIIDDLMNDLKLEYNKRLSIDNDKIKKDGDLFWFIEKRRNFFGYLFSGKLYIFNIYLKNKTISLNKDIIYYDIYKKSIHLFNTIENYKINKISKYVVETILTKEYNIDRNLLDTLYNVENIYKKDIINFVKKLNFNIDNT